MNEKHKKCLESVASDLEVLQHPRAGLQAPRDVRLGDEVAHGVDRDVHARHRQHGRQDAAVGRHEHEGRQEPRRHHHARPVRSWQPRRAWQRASVRRIRMRGGLERRWVG